MNKSIVSDDVVLVSSSLASIMNITSGPFLIKVLEVMQERPNWQSYLHGLMISQDDFDFITDYESRDVLERIAYFQNNDSRQMQFAKTFITLITSISRESTLQYVMTLLDNSLIEDHERVNYLEVYAKRNDIQLMPIFLQMLLRTDSFIIHQSSRIISKICCWTKNSIAENDLQYYFVWLKNQIVMEQAEKQTYLQTACRCLQMLLRVPQYRMVFSQLNGLNGMTSLLMQTDISFQIKYQLCFCLWLMSFNTKLADIISNKSVLPRLVELLFEGSNEKVVRIVLMLIRNLLEKPTSKIIVKENSRILLNAKILDALCSVEERKIEDDEMFNDLEALKGMLESGLETLTSFEEYLLELKSGFLSWSPVHKCEKFWKENVERLNDNNLEILKLLIGLIGSDSIEPLTLSIALYDIGQYVRYYHLGRLVIEKLNCKQTVMELLDHPDSAVRYQALLCLQRLMLQNVRYVRYQQMHGLKLVESSSTIIN